MSATIATSAAAALTAAVTVMAATMPEARDVLSPILEGGNEFAVAAGSLILSIPVLGVLTLLAASARD